MHRVIRRRVARAPEDALSGLGSDLLARVYRGRGVTSEQELRLDLDALLPPHSMGNLERAAALLADMLAQRRRITVVGDFDADGATSTALALSVLRDCGADDVGYLVPNRFEFGYGLTPEIVELAVRRDPDLIITVDNGISSIDGVRAARERGIATLVTDHHLPGAQLPAAEVIVNPNQPGCGFASKNLAGVGVIFYVMLALRAELRRRGWFAAQGLREPNLARYLDLVALGTVADVVPLDHNNRILVGQGLRRIRAGHACPGIAALLAAAGRNPARVVAADLGFAVGPRLNAAGRLDDMSIGIECLLSRDPDTARRLAAQLDRLNRERREIESDMQQQALAELESLDLTAREALPPVLTLYQPGWHQGVIGILAARVKERLHRPVIAFAATGDGELKGSARSLPGLHIRDILDNVAARNPGLISHFGGHAMAAGISLPEAHYEAFSSAFVAAVDAVADETLLEGVIETDGALAQEDFSLSLAETLRGAGPWGQAFPEPVFDGYFRVLQQRIVGDTHLKLVLDTGDGGAALDAIAFNVDTARWPDPQIEWIEAAYRLDVNEFRGRHLQLVMEYLQVAPGPG